jgi:N-acetylmuramoyl-L-alanine amidase
VRLPRPTAPSDADRAAMTARGRVLAAAFGALALATATATATATAVAGAQAAAGRGHSAPALAGKVVLVDPGHNGRNFSDPAAINRLVNDGNGSKACDTTGTQAPDGYTESEFNWDVALRLRRLLLGAGARVVMTRDSNSGIGPCITERAALGNRAHADAAISIHADGGPVDGSGFAVLLPGHIPSGANDAILAPSHRLGVALRSGLLAIGLHTSTYDGTDGLAVRTDLGGLNLSRVPKVFVEVANMQNAADERPMQTGSYRQRVARALYRAIANFLLAGPRVNRA